MEYHLASVATKASASVATATTNPWEVFYDPSYFGLWAARPLGDRSFNSPRLFHFVHEADARAFAALAEKAQ